MKITHVIIGLNVGGAELMLKRLIASHSGSLEYEHTVISLTDFGEIGRDFEVMGVKVVALGMRHAFEFPNIFYRLRKELLISEPDIVQTWMYHADLLGGLAARSIGLKNVIWGIRTTEIKAGGAHLTRVIRKLCAFLSHYIPSKIVCAADAAREVHEEVGYSLRKMLVVPNGFITDELIEPSSEQVQAIRDRAGLINGERIVGSVGRFNAVKDQKNFIAAAGILAEKYPCVRFMMVGREVEKSNAQLLSWIDQTGYAERFSLLGERSDVPACLSAMDIFCLHSRTEGFPNVVGEAMVMGKPCVVTDVGDAAVLVGVTGIVVPKENPSALADGIEQLLSLSPAQREALGVAARDRIRNNFTMEHARKRYEDLYHHLMSGSTLTNRND